MRDEGLCSCFDLEDTWDRSCLQSDPLHTEDKVPPRWTSLACPASLQKSAVLIPDYIHAGISTLDLGLETVVDCLPELNDRPILLRRLHDWTARLGEIKLDPGAKCPFHVC